MSIESLDVYRSTKDIASGLARSNKLKVVFMSPTLLRDPFRSDKYKSLTPTTMNIFSTPVYINLYLSGRLRYRAFTKTLMVLHRMLNEPYSIHRTTKVINVKYDEGKNPIPALVGYVNLYLNRDYYEKYTQKGLDVDELLKETLATTIALGTGTSRATGFGHVKVTAPSGSSAATPVFRNNTIKLKYSPHVKQRQGSNKKRLKEEWRFHRNTRKQPTQKTLYALYRTRGLTGKRSAWFTKYLP